MRVSFFIIIVLFSYFLTGEYNSYKAKATPFRILAVRSVILRLQGKSIASVILKVSWIIPVTKVCPSPCIIGEQDSVHVLNLNFVLKLAGEIEVERFFFSAMTFRVDNSEIQKLKKDQNSCSLPFVKDLFVKPVHLIKYR